MKKIYLLTALILFCCVQMMNAQDYKPFPTANAMWREFYLIPMSYEGDCEDYQYLITGDTVINSETYHKLQRTGYAGTHYEGQLTSIYYPINEYAGCFRNDTLEKKVWCVFPNTTFEQLLYDFNLQKRDSVFVNYHLGYDCKGIIVQIDTLTLSDGPHKRFHIFCEQIPWQHPAQYYEIIEGIGSTIGLFPKITGITYNYITCFSINEKSIYGYGKCTPAIAIKDHPQDKTLITLYPNPAYSTFQIKGIDNFQNITISIYNIEGECVMPKQKVNIDDLIHIETLKEGVYFVNICSKDNIVVKCKLIKL